MPPHGRFMPKQRQMMQENPEPPQMMQGQMQGGQMPPMKSLPMHNPNPAGLMDSQAGSYDTPEDNLAMRSLPQMPQMGQMQQQMQQPQEEGMLEMLKRAFLGNAPSWYGK